MLRSYLLLLIFVLPFSIYSQVKDDFLDNEFTSNPSWIGETAYFTVNPLFQLQSNGPTVASKLHLSTPNLSVRDTEWDFYAKLDLDITTTNWARFYLTSDRADTENNPKGYYVKLDGTTNSVDLYKQDSTMHTKLIAGKIGRAAKKTLNNFRIKVLCDTHGNWFLFSDSTATGNNFIKEGSAFDTTFYTSAYFGVYVAHSSTKRQKFYFDDLTIQPAPLSLLSAKAISDTEVDLVFSSPVDKNSAENTANYSFSPSSVLVGKAVVDGRNGNSVHLTLVNPINTYSRYTVTATSILDTSLKSSSFLNTASFSYRVEARYGTLIFSELFPDPSPQNGLPEVEFVEILNRNKDTLELENFLLSDGSTTVVFPSYKLAPSQYLIVCNATNLPHFSAYHPVLGLSTFPSLNNAGDQLTLKNQDGNVLHEVAYTDAWYGDNDKKEGGWSLEIIDVRNPCGEAQNWSASVHISGGTPGIANSIAASKPDWVAPQLLSALVVDSMHVQLVFDEEPMIDLISKQQFSVSKGLVIQTISVSPNSAECILLTFSTPFRAGEVYLLSLSGIQDCNGNSLAPLTNIELVRPEKGVAGDLIINELLFNPRSGGYDFVELFNQSEKYIELKNWKFANMDNGKIANEKIISEVPFILKPQEYTAFTVHKSILLNQYPLGNSSAIFELAALPSYNDDEGTVVLLDSTNAEFDRFDYTEAMHYALLDDKEGVSLERISSTAPTNTTQNWESASTQSGYATPGYRNSQHSEKTTGTQVWIEPKVFTPDQDGNNDFALINYKFDTPGNTVNITIYDHYGRSILQLARNELLASEGFYKWEGNNTQNEKVRSGAYIVYFELFNLKGEVRKYKEAVVVGW